VDTYYIQFKPACHEAIIGTPLGISFYSVISGHVGASVLVGSFESTALHFPLIIWLGRHSLQALAFNWTWL